MNRSITMANTLVTNQMILRTALMEFKNNLVLAKTVRRDYEKDFSNTTGSTIKIRKPTRYVKRTGSTMSIQPIQERYTEMTVGDMLGVDMAITSTQLALQLDDMNREVINPAMVTLANAVDSELYGLADQFYNYVGTAGTAPSTFAVADQANATLNMFGIPMENRFMLLKSFDASAMRTSLYNSFNEKFNTDIIMNGSMGNLASFDFYDVQNVTRPSRGSASLGTPAINNSGQSGTSLILDGFTASVQLKKGALFTIAGVNSVNPTSREDTGQLAQFAVYADTAADGSGNMTITLSPDNPITLTGPYQTVTALPVDGALLSFQATHNKNIFYHREAFAFVSVNLPATKNEGAWQETVVDPLSKIAIRMTRQYQIVNDETAIRFDLLPAFKIFPEYGGVMMGA